MIILITVLINWDQPVDTNEVARLTVATNLASRIRGILSKNYDVEELVFGSSSTDFAAALDDILETIRSNDSSPIFAVYIAILPSGVKCGETKNLRQRYSSLKASNDILHMYYLPVENKEQSTAAEDALHYIFDHAKGMRREKNKKDYYSCDEDYARKFIERNKREIYDAIMAEIEGD